MTSSSSKEQCEAVCNTIKSTYGKKMYFRAALVVNDDAGLHVELRIRRADLMGEPVPHIGAPEGVRVCVMLFG